MTTALGSILVIVIIGVVYYIFTNFDQKTFDKNVDRHVKKTLADVEMEKLKVAQEEARLKREYFEFEKAKIGRADRTLEATYTVKDQLEDKSKEKTA